MYEETLEARGGIEPPYKGFADLSRAPISSFLSEHIALYHPFRANHRANFQLRRKKKAVHNDCVTAHVLAIEQQFIAESLQQVATIRPNLAMVIAKGTGKKGGHAGK